VKKITHVPEFIGPYAMNDFFHFLIANQNELIDRVEALEAKLGEGSGVAEKPAKKRRRSTGGSGKG
jgi:hypothetical protein